MRKVREVILTFDYELFLGKNSGLLLDVLIAPTNRLLDLLNVYSAKGIFFVDSSYILKLKESNREDYNIVVKQVGEILSQGHDVGLHIHPHWLDAISIDDKMWDLSNKSKYRLSALPISQLTDYIQACYDVLLTITTIVDPLYKIKSFRAGGWSVQPFELLKDIFKRNQILFDFSVIPQWHQNDSLVHSFDYRKSPLCKWYWYFSNEPDVFSDNGEFLEIPMSTYKISPWLFWKNKNSQNHSIEGGRGTGASQTTFFQKARKVLSGKKIAALDDISPLYYNDIMEKIISCNDEVLTFVGHPKGFTEDTYVVIENILKKHYTLGIDDIISKISN